MPRGKQPDPTRARRGTGNRPKPGEAKPAKAIVPVHGVVVDKRPHFPAPESLPEVVRPVWDAAVADLGGAGHMRESFVPQLEAYCQAVYVHAQASANIHALGVLVEGPHGIVANPLIKVQKDMAATMLRFAETLGLTPAARIRLALEEVTGMSILQSLNHTIDGTR